MVATNSSLNGPSRTGWHGIMFLFAKAIYLIVSYCWSLWGFLTVLMFLSRFFVSVSWQYRLITSNQSKFPNCFQQDRPSMLEDAVEYLKALKLQVEVIALSVISVLQALPAINLFLFLSIRCCPWVVEQRARPHICHRLEFQVYQFPNFLYRHPWGQVQEWECLACLIRWVFQWHHFPQLCISILLYQQQQQQLDWIQWLHMKISPPLKCKCHSFPDGHYLQMQPHQVHRQHLQLGSLPHTIVLTKESLVLECTEGTPSDYHLPVNMSG